MSPTKRRYQTSIAIRLPPPPLPPPEYYSNLHYSYNRPITPAQITVNPCLTSKKLQTNNSSGIVPSSSTTTTNVSNTPVKKGSKPPPDDHHRQSRPSSKQKHITTTTAIGTITSVPNKKGNKTYRVTHHHQHRYEPPQMSTASTGTGQSRSSSLSQGIFGLPVVNEYFQGESRTNYRHLLEDNHEAETLDDQCPPFKLKSRQQKPRMKSTLPSFKNVHPTSQQQQHHQESTSSSHLQQQQQQQHLHHHDLHQQQEDMDGIIKVRPVSRQSRTRPEYSSAGVGGGSIKRSSAAGSERVGAARRRVQSTCGVYIPSSKPSTPISSLTTDANNNHLIQDPPPSHQHHHQQQQHLYTPDLVESILQKLKSQDADWEEIIDGFHSIQRLTSESPSIVKTILRKVIWFGLPHISSARTKLSRAACQCFKILFETQRSSMEGEGDKVFQRLLDLCGGQNNKFIQAECKVALLAAVENLDSFKCVHLLEQFGARHKNPNVREFAALLLSKIMEILSPEKLMSREFAQRILPMMVGFMKEGQLNTRLNAKQCLAKIFHHPDFQTSLKKFVPPESLRHVQDTLKKFQQQQQQGKQHQSYQKSRRTTTAAATLSAWS